MKALGKRGGSRPKMTALRREVERDAELLAKAKQVMADGLEGDELERRFEAAKGAGVLRAAAPPPPDPTGGDYAGPLVDGHTPISLADVVCFAAEAGALEPGLVTACRALVTAAEATPRGVSRVPFPLVLVARAWPLAQHAARLNLQEKACKLSGFSRFGL
jgi:hypothetical protein